MRPIRMPHHVLALFPAAVILGGMLALSGCQSPAPPPAGESVAELKAKVGQLEAAALDWPNRARYREANAQLGPPAAGEARVVFLGDSITDSWPQSGHFFAGQPCVGRGISGQTTPQMLVRFRDDVVALRPKVVVILAGTNDVAENTGPYDPGFTRGCIASMVELARASDIRVVLCSVLPAYDYPWRPGLQPGPKIMALNAWMRDYAAQTGCVYLDYFPAMADERHGLKAAFSEDGVHPNAAGYAVMESLAGPAIAAALAR